MTSLAGTWLEDEEAKNKHEMYNIVSFHLKQHIPQLGFWKILSVYKDSKLNESEDQNFQGGGFRSV